MAIPNPAGMTNPAGMVPGPAAGQIAWQQSQTPTTATGLGNAGVYLQQQNAELNSLNALGNQMSTAGGLWSRLQTIAGFNQAINQSSIAFSRGITASMLSDATANVQAMNK